MANIKREILTSDNFTFYNVSSLVGSSRPCGIYKYRDSIIWRPQQNNETQQWVDESGSILNNPDYNIVMYIEWGIDSQGFEYINKGYSNNNGMLNYLLAMPGCLTIQNVSGINNILKLGYFENQTDLEALGFTWYTPDQLGADGQQFLTGSIAGIAPSSDFSSLNIDLFHPVWSTGNTSNSKVIKITLKNMAEAASWWTSNNPMTLPRLFTPYVGAYKIGSIQSHEMIITCMWLGVERKK